MTWVVIRFKTWPIVNLPQLCRHLHPNPHILSESRQFHPVSHNLGPCQSQRRQPWALSTIFYPVAFAKWSLVGSLACKWVSPYSLIRKKVVMSHTNRHWCRKAVRARHMYRSHNFIFPTGNKRHWPINQIQLRSNILWPRSRDPNK
jgi:hypothetical protein